MYAVNERQLIVITKSCCALVCDEHKVLDKFLAASSASRDDIDALIRLVDYKLALLCFKLGAASLRTVAFEYITKLQQQRELSLYFGVLFAVGL